MSGSRQPEPAEVGLVQANMSLVRASVRTEMEGLRRHLRLYQAPREEDKPEEARPRGLERDLGDGLDRRRRPKTWRSRESVTNDLERTSDLRSRAAPPGERRSPHASTSTRALATDKRGRVTGQYNKQFLLAFGEYLPLGETFPDPLRVEPELGSLHPGDFARAAPDRITGRSRPSSATRTSSRGFVNQIVSAGEPDLLVNLTNDAWFGDTTEPWIHLALEVPRDRAPALLGSRRRTAACSAVHRSGGPRARAHRHVQGAGAASAHGRGCAPRPCTRWSATSRGG